MEPVSHPSADVAAFVDECLRAWTALASNGSLLDAADAAKTQYKCRTLRTHFRTEDGWQLALQRAEPDAIGCLLALAAGTRPEVFRGLALRFLATPALHGDESVMLECLRGMVNHDEDDETVFRAMLPFCVRSWNQGWMSFSRCRFARRGEVLAEFLNADDRATRPDVRWPKLGEELPGEEPPEGSLSRYGDLLTSTYPHVSAAAQGLLREAGLRLFRQASTVKIRLQVASALARMGESEPCLELCESSVAMLREYGCRSALGYYARDFVTRFGPVFAARDQRSQVLRASFDKALRSRLCSPIRGPDGRWIFIHQPWRWEPGNVYGEDVRSGVSLIWWHPQTGEQRHESIARGKWETQRAALSLQKDGGGTMVLAEVVDNSARKLRFYVAFDAEDRVVIASAKKDLKAKLGKAPRKLGAKTKSAVKPKTKPASRTKTEAKPHAALPAPPPPAPPPKPAAPRAPYEVAMVGRDRSSSQGKVAVSGHKHLGVVDTTTGRVCFAPPRSVAMAIGDDVLVSWRVERRDSASGVARGDYDWIVELYTFPSQPRLLRGYSIRSRDTIAWCWPVSIALPKSHGQRLVVLKARSEDDSTSVFVLLHEDGTFSETLDRNTALALLAGKDGDETKLVAQRVAADVLPTCYPYSDLGRAAQRYVAAVQKLGYQPLLRSGTPVRRVAALARRVGKPLPDEVTALLGIADGEVDSDGSLLGGYAFLSTRRMEQALAEPQANGLLPIAKEPLRKNYLGVALDAGADPSLPRGRVVAYGTDEAAPVVLFPSLTAFVAWLADAAETKNIRWIASKSPDAPSYLVHRLGRLPNAILRSRER